MWELFQVDITPMRYYFFSKNKKLGFTANPVYPMALEALANKHTRDILLNASVFQ